MCGLCYLTTLGHVSYFQIYQKFYFSFLIINYISTVGELKDLPGIKIPINTYNNCVLVPVVKLVTWPWRDSRIDLKLGYIIVVNEDILSERRTIKQWKVLGCYINHINTILVSCITFLDVFFP